jgi:UDP-N-acetylmuramoyl-tripeptide--D-alanyl-D-alanine ligase
LNTSEQILQLYSIFREHSIVSTDSRSIPPGSIFFALKGDKFDGNKFASNALEMGAAIAVVDDISLKDTAGMFYVPDVLTTLQDLAHFHRRQSKATIVALTGSNGKTTTKELMAAVLSKKYVTQSTSGNLNNHIGVPVTILSISDDTQFCIVEMGANHIGEISLLCEIADPDYGLITNIGKAHLEGFGSLEGVIRAKSELYDHIRAKSGKVFVNYDNPVVLKAANNLEHISYGQAESNFCSATFLTKFPNVSLQVNCRNHDFSVHSNLVGDYNFENILAAVCVGSYFDVDPSSVSSAIASYLPGNFRSQWIETERNALVMDAYNANPTSMHVAIQNFASSPLKNKMVILGEMLELGTTSSFEHQALVDLVRSKGSSIQDSVFIGRNFLSVEPRPDHLFESTDDFLDYMTRNIISNKTILIKGSRGNRLERIIQLL